MGKIVSFLCLIAAVSLRLLHAAPSLPAIEVVSQPLPNRPHTFGDSVGILLSADATWAAFSSSGSGLVTNKDNGILMDAFLKNLKTGEIRLISRTPAGAAGDGDSFVSGLSADGRFVLFESDADDLVAGDDNGRTDVFLYDRDSGQITEVSRTPGAAAEDSSGTSLLTHNGRFVLFETLAENLDPRDQNGGTDLFLWDRQSGALQLVSLNVSNSAAASGPQLPEHVGVFGAVMSEDGRYVAYVSSATNVVSTLLPLNNNAQLYLRDMAAGTNIWISRGSLYFPDQSPMAMSTNGARIVFAGAPGATGANKWLYSYAVSSNSLAPVPVPSGINTNAIGVDSFALSANGQVLAYALGGQIYRYDFGSGQMDQITPLSGSSNVISSDLALSDDGRVLIFLSFATNLISSPLSGDNEQLFSYDAVDRQIRFLTPNLDKTGGIDHDVIYPVLSAEGLTAGFMTFATDAVTNDDKSVNDVFITPVSGSGPVTLVSAPDPNAVSATANGPSDVPAGGLSADGRFVVFSSDASDIVANDDNDKTDLFLRDRQTGTTRLVSVSPDGVHPFPSKVIFLGMSVDARFIAFTSTNVGASGGQAIYVYDAQTGSNQVASLFSDGTVAHSNLGYLSADGAYLTFQVSDPVGPGIYVRDLKAQQTTYVTNYVTQQQFLGISPSGKYVAVTVPFARSERFFDWAKGTNVLVPGFQLAPSFSADDSKALIFPIFGTSTGVLLYDTLSGSTNLLSTNALFGVISADGSVAVTEDYEPAQGATLVLHDLQTGSVSPIILPQPDANFRVRGTASLSADGRYLAFATISPILGGASNGLPQIYVYDRVLTNFTQVSQRIGGGAPNFSASNPTISADGRTVVFVSGASDLVANDRNPGTDVFVARLPIADSDADGLDDGWELQHFGNLNQTGQSDADGDGQSNMSEFVAGSDPANGTSRFGFAPVVSITGRQLELSWESAYGKTYQVQSRSDLISGAWTNFGVPVTARGGSVSLQVPLSRSGSAFYRVLTQ